MEESGELGNHLPEGGIIGCQWCFTLSFHSKHRLVVKQIVTDPGSKGVAPDKAGFPGPGLP
jgi:hypothetical protein